MNALHHFHQRLVAGRRANVLSRRLADLLPPNSSVLDVGCGDGSVARLILDRRPDLRLRGVDVLVRPDTLVPVDPFDGIHLPCEDGAYEIVMLVDVLHHTTDPLAMLVEARRAASKGVIIKDHLCDGWLAGPTLRFMDRVGNRRFSVALPYNYWSLRQWQEAFSTLGLRAVYWSTRLDLYPWPAKLVFERSLHFLSRLVPDSRA